MAAWSDNEVTIIVADYLNMLTNELTGKSVNKTDHRNRIKPLLNSRSDGSIEFKHQNISAALIKMGLPYIKGYKPRWNYQRSLETELVRALKNNEQRLTHTFNMFAETAPMLPRVEDFTKIIDTPPESSYAADREMSYTNGPFKINYLEREHLNSELGKSGEELVIQFEKWRLQTAGREKFMDSIKWISKEDDSAGFDILSCNDDGSDRYIEVKTTKLAKDTPIFFTKNEFDFARTNQENFHLYRLYNFSVNPRLFLKSGGYDSFCHKEAIQFKGYF